jgi:hypothetical protein
MAAASIAAASAASLRAVVAYRSSRTVMVAASRATNSNVAMAA